MRTTTNVTVEVVYNGTTYDVSGKVQGDQYAIIEAVYPSVTLTDDMEELFEEALITQAIDNEYYSGYDAYDNEGFIY